MVLHQGDMWYGREDNHGTPDQQGNFFGGRRFLITVSRTLLPSMEQVPFSPNPVLALL